MEPSEPEIIDHLSQIYSKQELTKEAKFLDNKILFQWTSEQSRILIFDLC